MALAMALAPHVVGEQRDSAPEVMASWKFRQGVQIHVRTFLTPGPTVIPHFCQLGQTNMYLGILSLAHCVGWSPNPNAVRCRVARSNSKPCIDLSRVAHLTRTWHVCACRPGVRGSGAFRGCALHEFQGKERAVGIAHAGQPVAAHRFAPLRGLVEGVGHGNESSHAGTRAALARIVLGYARWSDYNTVKLFPVMGTSELRSLTQLFIQRWNYIQLEDIYGKLEE
ncbi:hypothetical protein B0H14DRAFT_2609621 [Mycena olivaceomarginata]|nr:hypothetical protein B0H14DRAFT_2609621 [Mycena olivaceomarginata]